MMSFRSSGVAALMLALAGPAAALTATADTDLNLRAGPGTEFPVAEVIGASSVVDVQGCIAGSSWCKVSHDGREGWASSGFLSAMQGVPVVAYDTVAVAPAVVPVVPNVVVEVPTGAPTAEKIDDKTTIYYPAPKVLLAPVGSKAATVVADPQVLTYVRANPVAPVRLSGDLVVGAGLPAGVAVYPVPNATLAYLNVNDRLVLVEPESRRVVEVIR